MKVKRICKVCGKEFLAATWHLKQGWSKCCSLKCRGMAKRNKTKRICKHCNKEFLASPSVVRKYCSNKCKHESPEWRKLRSFLSKGKHLSEKTCKKIGEAQKGERHWNWKGGMPTSHGRVLIYCPTHPYVNIDGYVLRYRLKMEKHLGRPLFPAEVVHHINGKTNDDRIKNLILFNSQSEHRKHHKGVRHAVSVN